MEIINKEFFPLYIKNISSSGKVFYQIKKNNEWIYSKNSPVRYNQRYIGYYKGSGDEKYLKHKVISCYDVNRLSKNTTINQSSDNFDKLAKVSLLFGVDCTRDFHYRKEYGKSNRAYRKIEQRLDSYSQLSHYQGKLTVALPTFMNSGITVIDIDKRSNTIKTKYIVKELESILGVPFYKEKSYTSGGYHLWFRFHTGFKDEAKKKLELEFQQKGMNIEVKKSGELISLPFSVKYRAGSMVPDPYIGDTISYKPIRIFDRDQKLSKDINFIEYFNLFYKLVNLTYQRHINKLPSKYQVHSGWLPAENAFNKHSVIKSSENENLTLESGNSFKKLPIIAFKVLNNNGSYSDFKEMVLSLDNGSKLMKSSQLVIDKKLKSVFSWASKKHIPLFHSVNNTNATNLSQSKFSPSSIGKSGLIYSDRQVKLDYEELDIFDSIIKKSIDNGYIKLYKSKKKNFELLRKIEIVYSFLKYSPTKSYAENKLSDFSGAVLLSTEVKNKIRNEWGISHSELKIILSVLENVGLVTKSVMKIRSGKMVNYSYAEVKISTHYKINDLNKIEKIWNYIPKDSSNRTIYQFIKWGVNKKEDISFLEFLNENKYNPCRNPGHIINLKYPFLNLNNVSYSIKSLTHFERMKIIQRRNNGPPS